MREKQTLTYRQVAKYIYKNVGKMVAYYYGYNPTICSMHIEEGKNPLVLDLVNEFMKLQDELKNLTPDNLDYEVLESLKWDSFYSMLLDYDIHLYTIGKHAND